jgi:hypothetical protein
MLDLLPVIDHYMFFLDDVSRDDLLVLLVLWLSDHFPSLHLPDARGRLTTHQHHLFRGPHSHDIHHWLLLRNRRMGPLTMAVYLLGMVLVLHRPRCNGPRRDSLNLSEARLVL